MSALSKVARSRGVAWSRRLRLAIAIAAVWPALPAQASDVDVVGTQAAAIEIPNIYGLLRRPGDTSGGPLDQAGDSTYAFQAYLDTGTSGIILSQEDAQEKGVEPELANGQPVTFGDVAVNGLVTYNVSETLDLRLAPYMAESFDVQPFPTAQTNAYFNQVTPGVRLQLSTEPGDPILGGLNLVGMPALKNKVMVVDARLYNHLSGIDLDTFEVHYNGGIEQLPDFPTDASPLPQLQAWVYDRGTADRSKTSLFDPGVPTGEHVVQLTYADFSRFTVTSPSNALAPTLAHNPFVGPAPFATAKPGDPQGITLERAGGGGSTVLSTTGSWLFDTGAQISFMSSAMALSLGVQLTFSAEGTPHLTDLATGGVPDGLFEVALGGAGGEAGTLLGFTVDDLLLPTTDGVIHYHDVQIGVLDVTVSDGTTSYTLDGDFGMNLLLPSMDVAADQSTSGAFDFFAFDEATGRLTLTDAIAVPEPASLALLGGAALIVRRRRR